MSAGYTFTTFIAWMDGEDERDACVAVTYTHYKGSPQTMTDPAEPPSVEIVEIAPVDPSVTLPGEWTDGSRDEELHPECFEDFKVEMEAAAEWRAQSRRDQMMEGF